MLAALMAVISCGAFVVWVMAIYSYIQLVRHRKPEVSLISLLTNGLDAFSPAKFTDGAEPHQTRLLWSMGGFFACVLSAIAVSIVGASFG